MTLTIFMELFYFVVHCKAFLLLFIKTNKKILFPILLEVHERWFVVTDTLAPPASRRIRRNGETQLKQNEREFLCLLNEPSCEDKVLRNLFLLLFFRFNFFSLITNEMAVFHFCPET